MPQTQRKENPAAASTMGSHGSFCWNELRTQDVARAKKFYDVDARLKKAVAGGASVIREPFDVEGVGRIAILREPGGAAVGWMTPAKS
jgi:predicted enzyme related to lactoylglutathione lyase